MSTEPLRVADPRPLPAKPPSRPSRLPALDFIKAAGTDMLGIFDEQLFEELVVRRRYFVQPVVFVSDPAGIRQVLVEKFDNYPRVPTIRRLFEVDVGTGTLGSEGETWRRHRRIATPALDPRALAPDVGPMIGLGEELAASLEPECGAAPFDLERRLYQFSDALWNLVVTGSDPEALPILAWLARVPRRPGILDLVPKPRWLSERLVTRRWDERRAGLDARLREMVEARRRPGFDGPQDLLWRLANAKDRETGQELPVVEVRDEAASLIAGNTSTTVRALTWAWYLLALHPDAEKRLHAELDTVLAGEALRPEQIGELRFARRVLEEAMRLYPPIPAIARVARQSDTICGQRVMRGSFVLVMPYIVHRHRRLWTDPDHFDPDRFLPENSVGRPRLAYLPFAAGPRVCVGASFAMTSMTVLLAAIARRYRVKLVPGVPVEPTSGGVSLRPRNGLAVTLERR